MQDKPPIVDLNNTNSIKTVTFHLILLMTVYDCPTKNRLPVIPLLVIKRNT